MDLFILLKGTNMSKIELSIMGVFLIIGLTFCAIYEIYTWIKHRKILKEWYKRTEISDQDIDSIIESFNQKEEEKKL